MIVLDASVIMKWLFGDENDADDARRFRDAHLEGIQVAAVPDLFFYEAANVLGTKIRLDPKDAEEAFSLLWNFELERFDLGHDEFLGALELCKKYGITFYDAAYVELARKLKCTFVTADKKLYEKTKSLRMVEIL